MANDYLKAAKLFNLNQSNGTSAIGISGASFIHGIHNTHSSNIIVTIDETYAFQVLAYSSQVFHVPVIFNTVKIDTSASHAAIIVYS